MRDMKGEKNSISVLICVVSYTQGSNQENPITLRNLPFVLRVATMRFRVLRRAKTRWSNLTRSNCARQRSQ